MKNTAIKFQYLPILLTSLLFSDNYVGFGSFTNNTHSARVIALSNATTAWMDGIESFSTNPAGIATLKGFNYLIGNSEPEIYSDYNNDYRYPFIAFGLGKKNELIINSRLFFATSIGVQLFYINDVDQYDENENYISQFNYQEYAISPSLAFRFTTIKFGLRWPIFIQSFGSLGNKRDNIADAYKPNIGLQYNLFKNTSIGLVYTKSTRIGKFDITPASLKVGFGYVRNLINISKINFGVDYERKSTNEGIVMSGLELDNIFYEMLSLRMGVSSNIKNDPQGWKAIESIKISFGFGIVLPKIKHKINIAYIQSLYGNSTTIILRNIVISINK